MRRKAQEGEKGKPKVSVKRETRCLFCNKFFEDGEQPQMVQAAGRPKQYFHYRCFVMWRDTVRRGG